MGILQSYPVEELFSMFNLSWKDSQLRKLALDLNLPVTTHTIAGGALVRSLMGLDIFRGDIDIFPHDEHALRSLTEQYKSETTWVKTKHAFNFMFKDGVRETKVQIITREEKPVDLNQTLSTFDFDHCKFALHQMTKDNFHVYTNASALISLCRRELRLAFVRDPQYSIGRAIKYKRLGFDADKALEALAALSIQGKKDVSLNKWDVAHVKGMVEADLEAVLASGSS